MFIQKLLEALKSKKCSPENLSLTLKDFVKIFRTDKVGERITKQIKEAFIEKKLK